MMLGAAFGLGLLVSGGVALAQETPPHGHDPAIARYGELMALDDRSARIAQLDAWLSGEIDSGPLRARLVQAAHCLRGLERRMLEPELDPVFLRGAMDPDPDRARQVVDAATDATRVPIWGPPDPQALQTYAQDFIWLRHYSYVDKQMSYYPSVGAYAVFLNLPDVTIRGWDVRQGDGAIVRSQDFARLMDDLAFLEGLQASQRRARRMGWPMVGGGLALLGGSVPALVEGIERGSEGPMILGVGLLCAGVVLDTVGARVLFQDHKRQVEVGYSKLISADDAGGFVQAYDRDLAERLGLDSWEVLGLEHDAVRDALLEPQSE